MEPNDDGNDPLDRELTGDELADLRPAPLAQRARFKSGLGRPAFCRTYGLPEDVYRQWESGEVVPDAVATAYLRAILNDPDSVATAYNKPRTAA